MYLNFDLNLFTVIFRKKIFLKVYKMQSNNRTTRRNYNQQEPQTQNDCPSGTYFHPGHTRDFFGQPRYHPAHCRPYPQQSTDSQLSDEEENDNQQDRQGFEQYLANMYPGRRTTRYQRSPLRNTGLSSGQGGSRRNRNQPEPQTASDCPSGTYFHAGHTRDFFGQPRYHPAHCRPYPQQTSNDQLSDEEEYDDQQDRQEFERYIANMYPGRRTTRYQRSPSNNY